MEKERLTIDDIGSSSSVLVSSSMLLDSSSLTNNSNIFLNPGKVYLLNAIANVSRPLLCFRASDNIYNPSLSIILLDRSSFSKAILHMIPSFMYPTLLI